ncbi:hypothetical protein A5712_29745 [Mycobacterium sp. E2327]|uniref:DUF1707 SHOCT-like domain-containing protein n=1 Tax=Mycobacterium sp. E2327 TaxID=1834132 RepID=UPI0007FE57E4|nr:DUF1707 domain-containing protein [Mycobacterium sp. E2327]OBI14911.1 hypothetical protein A5712_29745 [Mycobacterium sp. E2327]
MSAGYIRATDSDRDETGRVLDAALSDGQLSMEEYRQRVSAARRAATVGELESLVEDLQIRSAPAQPPTPASRRGILVAGVAVLALAGLGIGWKLLGNTTSSSPSAPPPSATSTVAITQTPPPPPPPLQLQTVDGLTGLLAQMRKQIGDTVGYRLVVYSDHADLDRPDPQDPRNSVTYHYATSGWSQWGASAIPSTSTAADLSKFNVQEVASVLRGAPQTLQVAGANNTYLMVESARDGSLALSVYVFRDRDGGHMELNADGTVRAIEPARR